MTDLPDGITEEIVQDVMKHTGKSRDDVIAEIKFQKNNFDAKEMNLDMLNDPNQMMKIIPDFIKKLSGSLNPVKFKVIIENLDHTKLSDVAALGKKWEDLEDESRK